MLQQWLDACVEGRLEPVAVEGASLFGGGGDDTMVAAVQP
jgi:hypothetical protein